VLPARHRLRSSADFAAVLQGARRAGGSRSGSRLIVVHANSTDARAGQPPRVGFVVSKAVGNAVVRNRTKRVLRHALASRLDRVPAGTDLVVRANPPAADAPSGKLGADVDRLLGTVLRRLDRPGRP
jgi:ribonuclease P protein component